MDDAQYRRIGARLSALGEQKLGIRGASIVRLSRKAAPRLPRAVRRDLRRVAEAAPLADHPRLRLTLDARELKRAGARVEAHLAGIDPADRRKGWWLGLLGGMAFNILLAFALLIVLLLWRGFI